MRKLTTSLMMLLSIVALSLHGADTYWNGSVDADWTNPDNWSAGVPTNGDWQSSAYFGDSATPTVITNIPYQSIFEVRFTTAGWTLNGSFDKFKGLTSSGTGTNTVTGKFQELKSTTTFTIATGNTLIIGDTLRIYDNILTLGGGGTFEVKKFIGSDFSSPAVRLAKITLRVNNSVPYNNSSDKTKVRFQNEEAVMELKTNVSSAENLIGSRIIDDTGLGLIVTDIGGGYVSITVAPPKIPGTVLIIN